ncbi:MAG: hypothetical protein WC490_00010 [Candidatus Margulisiibacteriota bacterium]
MMGIMSPLMKKVVEEGSSYPSPSEKVKVSKAIGRYKLMEAVDKWKSNLDDIRFAIADLLLSKATEQDYREALGYYNLIIKRTKNKVLKARAEIGRAELALMGIDRIGLDAAIKLCKDGAKLLRQNLSDFFVSKAVAVEAELLVKKGGKAAIRQASKLFSKIIGKRNASSYFRARSMVGKAELILYFGTDVLSKGIKLCDEAIKLLMQRPSDYFNLKARLIKAELLLRRGSSSDLLKAEDLCESVISSSLSHKDLIARAKLVLAELSKKERAKVLFEDVLSEENVDPYIIEKAKQIQKAVKERFN